MTKLDICKAGFGIVVRIFAGIFLVHGLAHADTAELTYTVNNLATDGTPIEVDRIRALMMDANTGEVVADQQFALADPDANGIRTQEIDFGVDLVPGLYELRLFAINFESDPMQSVASNKLQVPVLAPEEPQPEPAPEEPSVEDSEPPALVCIRIFAGADKILRAEACAPGVSQ